MNFLLFVLAIVTGIISMGILGFCFAGFIALFGPIIEKKLYKLTVIGKRWSGEDK